MIRKTITVVNIVIAAIIFMMQINVCAVDTYGGCNVPVDIDINGKLIKCTEKPILIEGTTYIPLRAFSDAVGGTLEWDEKELAAKVNIDSHFFAFYPETNRCIIDGTERDYEVFYYNNLTFIPIRAVSEILGYSVSWDDFYLTVKISTPDVVVNEKYIDKSFTYEDILYLAKITHIESGNEAFKTKLGVADTVVNRVKSSQFPNTVKEVIFDTKYGVQFPPAHSDKINTVPSKESVIAAKCALVGVNVVRNSIYFADIDYAAASWVHNNRPYYTSLGGIAFYE